MQDFVRKFKKVLTLKKVSILQLELKDEYIGLRNRLLFEKHFFTGAAGAGVIRLLPSLTISQKTAESFVDAWKELTL